ncbi:MAG TPA: DUF2834 domain-containing protein [Verrucomicrobiae bacterium]|jgi:multisubunit Na+/H+ antiporter MnhB subunit|nr:DUF2834 domain-containing protein [Verrucomicrobiae bacterium]
MNRKQLALSAALVILLACDAYSIYLYGYVGFFRVILANFGGFTAFVDLAIALVLILAWMGDDARARNTSAFPYVILTLALGSVGPLLYLIRRSGSRTERSASMAPRAVGN